MNGTMDQWSKNPDIVLSYLLGRRLSMDDLYEAFGVSKSTYYSQLDGGTLITPNSIVTVARNLGLNPIDLMLRFRIIDTEDLSDYLNASAAVYPWSAISDRTIGDVLREETTRPASADGDTADTGPIA